MIHAENQEARLLAGRARRLLAPYLMAVLAAALVAAGCAHVPVRETVQYADAFREVAGVTDELLGDYAVALDMIATHDAAERPAVYPIRFDPDAALAAEAPDPAVAGFQNALRAVEAYDAALLDIAQGESDAHLAGHAAAAAKVIESLGIGAAPAGVPAAELVRGLLSLLAQARTQRQFADAVTRGRPIVGRILHDFVGATPDFYRVRVGIVGAALTEIEFKQETVLDEIERIAETYAAPAAGTELALRRAQVETEVAALRVAVAPNAASRPLPAGPRPYDDDAQRRLEEQARVLRGLCSERRALAEGLTAYHDQLAAYVRLVDDTQRYFDALLGASGPSERSDAALHAHDTSTKATELRAAIRDTRSALALPATTQP